MKIKFLHKPLLYYSLNSQKCFILSFHLFSSFFSDTVKLSVCTGLNVGLTDNKQLEKVFSEALLA